MTNKQSTQQTSTQEPEKITPSLLLRGWNKTLETIDVLEKVNRESGVRNPDRFIEFRQKEPGEIYKKRLFLNQTVNPKTGEFYTVDSLIAGGHISESEKRLFGDLSLPRRELNSLHRIQTADKQEWLSTVEVVHGVTRSGTIVRTPLQDLHWYKELIPEYQYVDIEPRRGEDEAQRQPPRQARVAIVGRANDLYNSMYRKYFTPFSRESVEKAIRDTIPPYSERGIYDKISLILVKEGVTNCIVAPDLESFINTPFDVLWQQESQPAGSNVTNINVDPRQFQAFLKYQKEHEDHQYQ